MSRRAALLGLLLCMMPVLSAGAQDDSSLQALQSRYGALEGLRATFTQVSATGFADDSTRVEGTVLLAGNQYRVETPTQTVVTDGATTWIYSRADSQVVVNTAEAEASTLTPQTFLTTAAAKYDLTSTRSASRNDVPHEVLALTAANSSARFEEATLWVRRSDRIVTRLRAADQNGSTLDLRLRSIRIDPRINGDPFSFSVPENVEVVDLRPAN
ncbi:LolA family protein [Salinibacter altiplanensis]|uniref:LolA family protein n=1 Tax=Salinibacter altiplanensis TaxID=1803181 RepID=UPI000C9FFA41|nr:outer membrane lipoprotein carrier protein LolA [Salinibacter altiplanensis]